MSCFETIPQHMLSKTGEVISERFREWVNETKRKLLKAFPLGERAFCRIIDKLRSRLPRRWGTRLWYTRQKHFIVAPSVVFFGDFYFRNLRLLIEVDGGSHVGEAVKEKDEWQSKLITCWRAKTVRITNSQVIDRDFREVESWFLDRAFECCPCQLGNELLKDYAKVKRKNPHIYAETNLLTIYAP